MGSVTPRKEPKRSITQQDITALEGLLANTNATLVRPGEPQYDQAIARWSMAASKPAGLVVAPTTAKEVSIALKYASENNIDVAVKGGGHSTAGASSTSGGLMFWLEKMRGVKVEDWPGEEGQKVFRIQGGASWGDVDDEGVKHGLHTVEGTVADTGVGGLTLGGGYGWLSGKYGLTVDCMVEVEVVLSSGEIVRANEKENSDLLWALGGAGQNFGVSTEFILKAYPQGEVWCGMLAFESNQANIEKVVAALNDIYTPSGDGNGPTKYKGKTMGGLGFFSPPPAEGKIWMFVAIIWNGDEASGKEAWKPVLDMKPLMNTMSMQPFPTANTMLAPPMNLRSSMKGSSFTMPIRPAFVGEVLDAYKSFMAVNPADRGPTLLLFEVYDPHQVAIGTKGCFANRGYHLNALIAPIWTKPELDTECRQWARDVNEMFKKELQRQNVETGPGGAAGGVGVRGRKGAVLLYGNYDQYDEKSRDIFGENHEKLQALKARYDPGMVFDKLFVIQPDQDARL